MGKPVIVKTTTTRTVQTVAVTNHGGPHGKGGKNCG